MNPSVGLFYEKEHLVILKLVYRIMEFLSPDIHLLQVFAIKSSFAIFSESMTSQRKKSIHLLTLTPVSFNPSSTFQSKPAPRPARHRVPKAPFRPPPTSPSTAPAH